MGSHEIFAWPRWKPINLERGPGEAGQLGKPPIERTLTPYSSVSSSQFAGISMILWKETSFGIKDLVYQAAFNSSIWNLKVLDLEVFLPSSKAKL